MKLSAYIQRTRALGEIKIPDAQIDALGDQIKQGCDLAGLLKQKSTLLTPRALLGIWRAAQKQQKHEAFLAEVNERRVREGLAAIPMTLLRQTVAAHEMPIVETADSLAPHGQAAEHRRRDAVKEALVLWNACLAIVRRDALAKVTLVGRKTELRELYADYTCVSTLPEISSHRWLAIRRGMAQKALALKFIIPQDALQAQVVARGAELYAVAQGRRPDELLKTLVLPHLESTALALKDEEARWAATRSACTAYMNLLCADRPKEKLLAGIYLPTPGSSEKLAVAVLNRDGHYLSGGEIAVSSNPTQAELQKFIEILMGSEPVAALVLPATGHDEMCNLLTAAFAPTMRIYRARGLAMSEALRLQTEDLPNFVARALVLGRRIARPLKYWGSLDPIHLGLVEYQNDLDEQVLRTALLEMRVLANEGIKPEDLQRGTTSSTTAAPPAAPVVTKPLNPMIKTIDDLMPGMMLNCIVTNIAQFGAFVNMGLGQEGLIHISELSDGFVQDPNEIVKINQQLSARVISVDRVRRRISLSLRPERQQSNRRPSEERMGPSSGRRPNPLDDLSQNPRGRSQSNAALGGLSGASRAQTLAKLDALFKK